MATSQCGCSDGERRQSCTGCVRDETFPYWCTSCERSVPEKRCPHCGLKTRKKKGLDPAGCHHGKKKL